MQRDLWCTQGFYHHKYSHHSRILDLKCKVQSLEWFTTSVNINIKMLLTQKAWRKDALRWSLDRSSLNIDWWMKVWCGCLLNKEKQLLMVCHTAGSVKEKKKIKTHNKLFVRRLPKGPLADTYQVNVLFLQITIAFPFVLVQLFWKMGDFALIRFFFFFLEGRGEVKKQVERRPTHCRNSWLL